MTGLSQTGKSIVGLADIASSGAAGRALEKVLPAGTGEEYWQSKLSPAQQYAQKRVQEAEGFMPTMKAALENPSTIAGSVIESVPMMIGGMGVGRALLSKAPTLVTALGGRLGMTAEAVAGAIGEGAISAGALAEGIREQTEKGDLSLGQSALALAGGIGTGVLSMIGGKISDSGGFADIDSFLLGSGAMKKPVKAAKAIVAGGITEGLEEMPQEIQEQVIENAALDRPLMQGVPESAAQALLAGAAMGSGANIIAGVAGQDSGIDDQGETTTADTQPVSQPPVTDTGTASEMIETVINGLNTGQLNPDDPAQAEIINSVREQMRSVAESPSPEVQEVVAQNRDVLERIGALKHKPTGATGEQVDTEIDQATQFEAGEPQFPEEVALARAQAIQPKDRTPEEAKLVKDYQERVEAEELAIRRARAIDDQYRTTEEREIVRAAEQREQEGYAKEEIKAGQTAQAAEETGAKSKEEQLVEDRKLTEKRVKAEAEEFSREHPAHRAMTEAIKQGGINLDLARKEGWDLDTLKDVRRPGLFSKNATMGPDEMAQTLGYDSEADMRAEWVKAPTKKELKGRAEAEYTGQDQAIEESVSSLEKEGFELGTEDAVNVGDLNPGDEVVVMDRRGVPDKLTHKGYAEDGDALLQDGVTIKADPFEEIKIIAKKTGDTEASKIAQQKFEEILEETDPQRVKSFANKLPGEIKNNPKLKPFQELIEAAVDRRLDALDDKTGSRKKDKEVQPDDAGTGGKSGDGSRTEANPAGEPGKGRKELLEPITEKEGTPQLDTEERTRYLGEKEGRTARTESKRRQIGEAKKFQETRRDPKKQTQITEQQNYKETLPANTERLMNITAERYRAFNDAQASVDENKEHLVRLFDKDGTDSITVSVGGQKFTVKKPLPGKEQVIMNLAGRDALDALKQKYKDAGLLTFDYDQGVTLMVQPAVAGKSKAAAYGPKSLEAAAREHVRFMKDLAEARFAKDAARRRITESTIPKLTNDGIDHAWTNSAKDTTFWVERSPAIKKFATEEAKEAYQQEREEAQARPEFEKKRTRKLKTAGVSEAKAQGLKRGEKADRQAAAEAELDQILKSISGTPLPKGQRADIMGELADQLGRGVLAQQKRGVFEVVSPERAAQALATMSGLKRSVKKPDYITEEIAVGEVEVKYSKDGQRIEGLYFPKTGKVWLVDGNIEKGEAVGVLAHDLGVHALQLGFKETEAFERILKRVDHLVEKGNDPEVNAARQRAIDAKTPANQLAEETLGYLMNNAKQHPLVRRLWAALKKFLSQKTNWNWASIEKFTPADMQAMAQSAIRANVSPVARTVSSATAGVNEFAQSVKVSTVKAANKIKGMANFKKWFGDSKVVDENGEPKVVFHGTNATFTRFDEDFTGSKTGNLGHYGKGFYFSDDIREAKGYGKNVIESFLSMENPFVATRDNINSIREEFGHKKEPVFISSKWLLDALREKYPVGHKLALGLISEGNSAWEKITSKDYRESKVDLNDISDMVKMSDKAHADIAESYNDGYLDKINELIGEPVFVYGYPDTVALHHLTEMGDEAGKLTDLLRSKGYDGVIAGSEYVVFEPTQIKSIHNTGEWSPTDPDIMMSMSAPAQETRRNTENLNATKDGQTSTTSAEAGEKAIQSIMETLHKVRQKTEEELEKEKTKERKFLDQYRQVVNNQTMPIDESVSLLNGLVRQADIPDGSKKRIGQLIKSITAAKRPETQRKRLNSALETLRADISKRLRSQIRAQVKRAAGPKREGVIKRGRYWHEQEKDITSIREIVHNMSPEQAIQAIARVENRLDGLHDRLKGAAPENAETIRSQITDAELRLHHLRTFGGLKDKSLDQLIDAKYQIEELRRLGRSKLRAVKEAWQQEIDRKTNWLAQEITGKDDPRPETVAQKNRRRQKEKSLIGKVKGTYKAVGNSIESWEGILDIVAGNAFYFDKNGKRRSRKVFQSRAVKELGSMAHAATRGTERYNRETTEQMLAKGLEIFGVKKGSTLTKRLQKLAKKTGKIQVAGDTLQLSPMEAAYFYNVRKEPGSEKLFRKMGFTPETWSGIDSLMTKELKAWADYLHDDLLADALQGETEAYRAVNGVDRVPVGLFRDDQTDIPVMNLNSAVMNRIFDANHYRAWAVPSKTFNDLFSVPETRGFIEQYAGTSTLKALDKFLEDFAKTPRELRGDMAWMDKLRSNVVMSMIGANPTTFFKQLTSIPAYAADIPTAAFVKNFAHGLASFGAVRRMIKDSQMAQERFGSGYDRDIHEASKATAEQVIGGKITNMRDLLMAMTKLGDMAAVYAGYTVYKYHYDKNGGSKNHKEAHRIGIEEFERATERTQQAAGVKDRGSFERGSSLQKLLTMYMTSPAAYTRQTMAALRHFKTDPVGSSKRLLLFNIMLPMAFQAVASGFVGASGEDDEQWEEFWAKELRAVALGPFLGLPIARDIAAGLWDSAMGEWYGSDVQHSPVTETTKSLTQAVFHASKGLREFDDEAIERAKGELLDFLGYAAGLPIKPGRRMKEGLDDFLSGDTEHPGLALLGWSRAARDEPYLGD
jgi:hypothetical protein